MMHKPDLRENQHNPTFTYGNLVTLINSIRAQGPGADSKQLDQAFNANDTIVFLGAVGAAELAGDIDYGYRGGDVNTPVRDFGADINIDWEGGGYHERGSGKIRVDPQTWMRLMQGRPAIVNANVAVHEVMHRGFSMLWNAAQQYKGLQQSLPSDLYGAWQGGWGVRMDWSKFPMVNVTNSQGEIENPRMQINPEHCMIYAMTTQPNSAKDQVFIQTVPQLAWGARYFTPDWHTNFNNRYDDLTRDRPTDDIRRMRTYWRILYYNTERALSRWLRSVLRQPPNMPTSPRPQPRQSAQPSQSAQGPMTLGQLMGARPISR
jgi:hypothetical protein